MSRIGKLPITIPIGVKVVVEPKQVRLEGPKGRLTTVIPAGVNVKVEGNIVRVEREGEQRHVRALHGLTRKLIANMTQGVSQGFSRVLEINGVGYRAQADAKTLKLQLGFSHDVEVPIPEGITIKAIKPTEVEITGSDRQRVGQLAAEIRGLRPPEPYKGKGIKYSTETIRRKEGKKK